MNYLYFLFRHLRRHSLNRTPSYTLFVSHGFNHGWTLGGPRYIHLTKGTNAVFSGFFSLLATVAISMNPITFVMNFYCNLLWHPGQSLMESNSDLPLLNFRRCQPWLNLRRRLLYPFNYENECRIFGLFCPFWQRLPYLWIQSLSWWIISFSCSDTTGDISQIELWLTTFLFPLEITIVST